MPAEPHPASKGELLLWLRDRITTATVPESILVDRATWQHRPADALATLRARFGPAPNLIVRSSARTEDLPGASQAGRFLSLAGVSSEPDISAAISRVLASYDTTESTDIVLIQPMLVSATTAGVVFTADPTTGSPYLIVNYAAGADTSAVTSGSGNHSTWVSLGDGAGRAPTSDLQLLPPLVQELTDILPWTALDIEFAVADGRLYLLQARPLSPPKPVHSSARLLALTSQVERTFKRWSSPRPGLVGTATLLGVMPDWNPAEIIGVRPRPLALSLYRFLVTDDRWATQRALYGYRPVPGVPLLLDLHGLPYVDVRASCNSLTPAALPESVSARLVDACLALLSREPGLHDKFEFRVIPSCFSYDLEAELERRFGPALNQGERAEICEAIRTLTVSLVRNHRTIAAQENHLVEQMQARRTSIHSESATPLDRIFWLLTDCGEFGTRPFVGQARRAFAATEIIRSLVRGQQLAPDAFDRFSRSLNTVAKRFQRDRQTLDRTELMSAYGHLRPGTYDIRSLRYDEAPDLYFSDSQDEISIDEVEFALTQRESDNIERFLEGNQFEVTASAFLDFARESIESRESTKFAFTRNLSDALAELVRLGTILGISRDDLSYLTISDVLSAYPSAERAADTIAASVSRGRMKFAATAELVLPALIRNVDEVSSFINSEDEPNFVGSQVALGSVTEWPGTDELRGSILFIQSADPGYDWIFGHRLAGFVTMYGGANSHMAIRAYELGVTAVIGAGPSLYSRWRRSRMIRIDPVNQKVEPVR